MSQNTELKAQAKKPGLNKKGIAAWINNYSFILIALAIFIAYLFINHGATTWSGVMNPAALRCGGHYGLRHGPGHHHRRH